MPINTSSFTPAFVTSGIAILLRPILSHPQVTHYRPAPSSTSPPLFLSRPLHVSRPTASASTSASTPTNLDVLRRQLATLNVHALIVPTPDPHNSEYPPGHYARRAFISSFNGSAGTAVITPDAAFLWTDGRYFLQAESQLDHNWTLMRAGQPETPTIPRFLAENVPPSEAVAIDPFVHSLFSANALKKELETSGRRVVPLIVNPIDAIWGPDRPPLPSAPIRIHDLQYAGLSVSDKLCSLRQEMTDKDCSHMLLSMLDEVCWTFNIRGSDVPHCPVVLSYAIIDSQGASLYVDAEKVPPIVHTALKEAGISIKPYDSVVSDLNEIAANGDKIWLDPSSTSLALADAAGKTALHETTPVQMAKARKNDAELQGMRAAHIRDGVALSMFLCWLEDYVASGEHVISEAQAANKLEEFRASQRGFLETSFGTIAGSGSNGAIIHYSPQPDACRDVNNKDVFLLDSGGQYVDGTTDVTRTMHFGNTATEHEKECFTRVLKGHIAIDTAVFPEGTTGLMLDCLARIPLWSTGLDYAHGTGHGVGACLNVHEGPHSISPRVGSNKAGLKAGMVVSNEPGYYEDGSFGIRIENLLIVVNKNTAHEFNSKKFLGFERLTFVPIDRNMIAQHLLSTSEIEWLDKYHEQVWEKLSPGMEKGSYTDWLWKQTRPLVEEKAESPENADEVMTAPL